MTFTNGQPNHPTRGRGRSYKFLVDHVRHDSDECLLWPFSKLPKGYGTLGYCGKVWRAHRLMCILKHGEPPNEAHHAAHSCGNRLFVNPKHLSWKTSSDNHLDQRTHGTSKTSLFGKCGALEPDQVRMIRALHGVATQAKIAEQFGVSEETVRRIHNRVSYNSVAA